VTNPVSPLPPTIPSRHARLLFLCSTSVKLLEKLPFSYKGSSFLSFANKVSGTEADSASFANTALGTEIAAASANAIIFFISNILSATYDIHVYYIMIIT